MAKTDEEPLTDAEITEGLQHALRFVRTGNGEGLQSWINAMSRKGKAQEVGKFWRDFKNLLPQIEAMCN
jgi:hypothetical protein